MLEPVTRTEAPVRHKRPFIGQRSPVAAEHLARSPSEQAHGVSFASAQGEPVVRSSVPELMRVNASDARSGAPATKQLGYSRCRERTFRSKP